MLPELFLDARRVDKSRQRMRKLLSGFRDLSNIALVQSSLIELHVNTERLRRNIMASKKVSSEKAEFKGFANVELTIEQKDAMRVWIREEEEVALAIENLIASGHKITVVHNEANGAYQASAFCTYLKSKNAGMILSAFAPHWYDAIACLCFKHYVVCNGGIWKPDTPQDASDLFG